MNSVQAECEIISTCGVIRTWGEVQGKKADKIVELLKFVVGVHKEEVSDPDELWRSLYLQELKYLRSERLDRVGNSDGILTPSKQLTDFGKLAAQRATILYNSAYEHFKNSGD